MEKIVMFCSVRRSIKEESCIAQWKTGQRCGMSVTAGNAWCDLHTGKLYQYYHSYKTVESQIPCLTQPEVPLNHYTTDELKIMVSQLLKAHHYRVALRAHLYPDYTDEGHDFYISSLDKKIAAIHEVAGVDIPEEPSSSDNPVVKIPSPPRPAQPTSIKQVKRGKKWSKHLPQLNRTLSIVSDEVSVAIVNTVWYYTQVVLGVIDRYFTDKFGCELGTAIKKAAFSCVNSIAGIFCSNHKSLHGRKELRFIDGPVSKLSPDDGTICNPVEEWDFMISHLDKCASDYGVYGTILYICSVIIHSFRIDADNILKQSQTEKALLPFISSILPHPGGVLKTRREELMKLVKIATKSGQFSKYKGYIETSLKTLEEAELSIVKEWPQLDIAFCIKAGKLSLKKWVAIPINNHGLYFFHPLVVSVVMDVSGKKLVYQCVHLCSIVGSTYYQYCKRMPQLAVMNDEIWLTIIEGLKNGLQNVYFIVDQR